MSVALANKYSEIETIKNRFLNKIERLSEEQFNKIPENNGWSAGQTLYHCAFAESGSILVINKNLKENKVTLDSNIGSVLRNILLVITLKLPLKFKAPKQVSKVPDSISKDEIKKYFDKNTKDFIKILEELPVDLEDKLIFKHPISGLFSITQTLNFVREHYLHHERQLNALL
jgi:uncharacterized damage-inducible protein DinB